MHSYPLFFPTKIAFTPNLPVLGKLPNLNSYWRKKGRKEIYKYKVWTIADFIIDAIKVDELNNRIVLFHC
jgi:hypothetical protein